MVFSFTTLIMHAYCNALASLMGILFMDGGALSPSAVPDDPSGSRMWRTGGIAVLQKLE